MIKLYNSFEFIFKSQFASKQFKWPDSKSALIHQSDGATFFLGVTQTEPGAISTI